MSLKAGIIGMPNVGKSTLFNAITKKNILAANYPFATIDPNVGVVTVSDKRLEVLESMYLPERTIPTQYEFIDIAGLVKGASQGEGLGNKFLSHIREVDAIVQVVRCFDDKEIIHVDGVVNPVKDAEVINYELILSDLEIVENRISKIEKKAQTTNDIFALFELKTLKIIKSKLGEGIPLRLVDFTEEEFEVLKPFNFITLKPMIYLANVNEESISDENNKYVKAIKEYAAKEKTYVVVMCAKIESELSELNEDDKNKFLKDLGIPTSGLDQLINVTYMLLGLKTFFTVGSDEVKAWTFKVGMKAPECAGIIHSDFEKGFIRAEVIKYEDLIEYKSELKVKEAGKMKLEGKEYLMQDGDICHFRFNN